jgi:hypothetical protein
MVDIELILYVAPAEKRRPELAKRLRARRKLIAEVVATSISAKFSARSRMGRRPLGRVGGRLSAARLIDPTSTPADSFFEAVERLQRLIAA